jgi:hypothetical protein
MVFACGVFSVITGSSDRKGLYGAPAGTHSYLELCRAARMIYNL